MWMFLLILLVLFVLYEYAIKQLLYWKDRGIPNLLPMPPIGNMWRSFMGMTSIAEDVERIYNQLKPHKFGGTFMFQQPTLTICGPELIKQIGIKDFDHFFDHTQVFFNEELDPLFAKNLFSLTGKKWKDMRSTLSPAFTSSKMKSMFAFIAVCGDQLANYLKKEIEKQNDTQILEVDMKDIATRFANDVIASSAFGIQCDSLVDENNDFYYHGKQMSKFSTWRFVLCNLAPWFMKLIGQGVMPRYVCDFFKRIVHETIEIRERDKIIRPDMIHLMMEARKGHLKHENNEETGETGFAIVEESSIGMSEVIGKTLIKEDDIVAQAFIFFGAGFDTSSNLMSFTIHELAVNPDIQKRLQREIDNVLAEYNGKVTYEGVNKMKYLDMVTTETLRLWSPAPHIERLCTKSYVMEVNGRPVKIEKGTMILIPVYGIHRDPEYYPNPTRFDPDRFSDENKKNIHPLTFLPFGVGPRNCIGSRFALLENKVLIIQLLKNFDVIPIAKTQTPLKLKKTMTAMIAEKGYWVGFQSRKK